MNSDQTKSNPSRKLLAAHIIVYNCKAHCIEEFEQNTFWEELISNLADRDVLKNIGTNSFSDLSPVERISATYDAEAKWAKEFEKNGLNRIGIVEKN